MSEIHENINSDIPISYGEDEDDEIDVDCVPVTTVIVSIITFTKGSTLLIAHDDRVSGTFLFGNLSRDWKPRMLIDAAKVHMYAPDPEDCVLLLELQQVVCQLKMDESIVHLDGDYQLEINEQGHHQAVRHAAKRSWKEEVFSCRNVEHVSVGHTSRGRSLCLPNRFRE